MTTELDPYSGPEYDLKHNAIRQKAYLTCLRLNDGTECIGDLGGSPIFYNSKNAVAAQAALIPAYPPGMDADMRQREIQRAYWKQVELGSMSLRQRLAYWWWGRKQGRSRTL